jgi:hypothetical protein
VGAGIVGLAIARHLLLLHTSLSVAIADAAVPCSGATGAGSLPLALALMVRCFSLYGVGCNTSLGLWFRVSSLGGVRCVQGRGTYGCRTGGRGVTRGSWRCGASDFGRSWRPRLTARVAAVHGRDWVG